MKKDLSFEYPDAVLEYNKEHKFFPKDLHFEPGIYCAFDDLYFIHTTATLPLTDIDNGIGFGLCQIISCRKYHPSSCKANATLHGIPIKSFAFNP